MIFRNAQGISFGDTIEVLTRLTGTRVRPGKFESLVTDTIDIEDMPGKYLTFDQAYPSLDEVEMEEINGLIKSVTDSGREYLRNALTAINNRFAEEMDEAFGK